MSVRYRIALSIFAFQLCLIGVIVWQTTSASLNSVRGLGEKTHEAILGAVAHEAANHLLTREFEDFQIYIESLVAQSGTTRIFLSDDTQTIVAASTPGWAHRPLQSLDTQGSEHRHERELIGALGHLGTLHMDFSNAQTDAAIQQTLNRGLGIGAMGVVLSTLISLILGTVFSRRVEMLTRVAERLAEGDLSVRSSLRGRDELAQLGQVFNDTVAKLEILVSGADRRERGIHDLYENTAFHQTNPQDISHGFLSSFSRYFQAPYALLLEIQGDHCVILDHVPESLVPENTTLPLSDLHCIPRGSANEPAFQSPAMAWEKTPLPGLQAPEEDTFVIGTQFSLAQQRTALMLVVGAKLELQDADQQFIQLVGRSLASALHRAELEEHLLQAQKMEAVGQLTGGIAHDFNNLLAVVIGNLELAAGQADDPEKLQHHLARARQAAERGAALTHRLLAFSRKQPLEPTTVHLGKLLRGMADLLRRSLGETIDLEIIDAAGLWNCEADPSQVENSVLNLAINARDAMPDGGKLTIETANIRLDDEYSAHQVDVPPGQYVLLAVTDTGSGMDESTRKRVFEPFFTTKQSGKGSGLGLSMVFGFVKQSHGHISIYSEPEQGTSVRIYLPKSSDSSYPQTKTLPEPQPSVSGERILVVEDDPMLLEMTRELLESLNYRTHPAQTAAEAETMMRQHPDMALLLTDVILPGGVNGRQLADQLKRQYPKLRVLYMSGYSENAIIHHGKLDPGVMLLNKPFRRDQLAAKVREALHTPA